MANAASAPIAHAAFALMAAAALLLLAVGAIAEFRAFARDGLGRAWCALRLAVPGLFAVAGLGLAAVASGPGRGDAGILAYMFVLVLGLPLWVLAHLAAGWLLRPRLPTPKALWLAISPVLAAMALVSLGHTLQPAVWRLAAWLARGGP